jgi:hypothetical protein
MADTTIRRMPSASFSSGSPSGVGASAFARKRRRATVRAARLQPGRGSEHDRDRHQPARLGENVVDKSLEFTRYRLTMMRGHQQMLKCMEKFGVLGAIAGGTDSDREQQMDQLRDEFDEAFFALDGTTRSGA